MDLEPILALGECGLESAEKFALEFGALGSHTQLPVSQNSQRTVARARCMGQPTDIVVGAGIEEVERGTGLNGVRCWKPVCVVCQHPEGKAIADRRDALVRM